MPFGFRRGFGVAVALVVLAATPTAARAQAYPSKPVRLLVGFPAGGSTDLLARTLAPGLSQATTWPNTSA